MHQNITSYSSAILFWISSSGPNLRPMQELNYRFRHILYMPVRFSDLDAMGHVNNARYLTFYEEGRSAWFRDCAGMPPESTAYPVIVARVELDFLLPILPGENVYVANRCSGFGGKSMTIKGLISLDHKLERIASRYTCTMVYYDYEKGVSIPIPQSFKERVIKYESGS